MYNIMVIEDDFVMAQTISKFIEKNSNLELSTVICIDQESFNRKIDEINVDLVVTDYKLGFDFTGENVIDQVQKKLGIPVIVISGYIGEEMAAKLMRMGASDLIVKKNLERLVPAIEREIKEYHYRKNQLKEFKKAYNLLSQMASSVNWILKHDISDISLKRILKDYASIVEADRSYLFEKKKDSKGIVYYEQILEYCKSDEYQDGVVCQGWVGKIYEEDAPYFFRRLVDGPTGVSFLVSDLPDRERTFFEPQGIKSIAYIPVYTQNNIWGFFGFDDCNKTRVWSDLELKALESVSAILGTLIYKMKQEEYVKEKTKTLMASMTVLNDRLQKIQSEYK